MTPFQSRPGTRNNAQLIPFLFICAALAAGLAGCGVTTNQPDLEGKEVAVRFLHTTDIHSRLIPYRMEVTRTDETLGLDPEKGPFGGISRIAWIAKTERAKVERSLFIDTGDSFQGAPIFNLFQGEVELKSLSTMGVDVSVLGNHEFDSGEPNLADKVSRFAVYPMLGANYLIEPVGGSTVPPLRDLVYPYQIFNLQGLRVGVIGLANTSTMNSLYEAGNSMGINPLEAAETAQFYIDVLRPQVDVIVVASHLGLTSDEELIPCISGADIVLGGHHHVVLNPPKEILDAGECFYSWNTDHLRNQCEKAFRKAVDDDGTVVESRLVDACDTISEVARKLFSNLREEPGRVMPPVEPGALLDACVGALDQSAVIPPALAADPAAVSDYLDAWVSFKCYEVPRQLGWTQPARRKVPLAHSGAFAKYVGLMDVVFAQVSACSDGIDNDGDGKTDMADPGCVDSRLDNSESTDGFQRSSDWDLESFKYRVIPVDSTVPTDPLIERLLEPYVDALNQAVPLNQILGYAPATVSRFGATGGDSAIGNVVAQAMMGRRGVETDFAVTNSLGIRSDFYPGPITIEWLFNVFPFENSITTMYLSGREVVEMFDFIARRSSDRGCSSQAQVAGVNAVLQCGRCDVARRAASGFPDADPDRACAVEIVIGGQGVKLDAQYQLAANDYIAAGGSGFTMLKRNTTKVNTEISLREALTDQIRQGRPCGWRPDLKGLQPCTRDGEGEGGCDKGYMCSCQERSVWNKVDAACVQAGECAGDSGFCVPANCVNDVMDLFVRDNCVAFGGGPELEECMCLQKARAYAQCQSTPCVDRNNGFAEDGRLLLLAP
ncbi:MAG TPA: bifunctional UDP-sugar hydrolase/5'-nucleotidase [Myxococcota bacterium]|nr:bifunctional UDP-sugar hydrolase/5'-nucleotidase [Myxococcota bacterium]HOH77211.1 bifunctional UDP-sugar hydrolase/5'-nucleotidase [Myxococcota bacterium]